MLTSTTGLGSDADALFMEASECSTGTAEQAREVDGLLLDLLRPDASEEFSASWSGESLEIWSLKGTDVQETLARPRTRPEGRAAPRPRT